MHYLNTEDVIIAQCTSEGFGAINVIRISGLSLVGLYKKITKTKKSPTPNTIIKKAVYSDNVLLDQCLVSYFMGPNSFTGEDIIEINCHGGGFIASGGVEILKAPKVYLPKYGKLDKNKRSIVEIGKKAKSKQKYP